MPVDTVDTTMHADAGNLALSPDFGSGNFMRPSPAMAAISDATHRNPAMIRGCHNRRNAGVTERSAKAFSAKRTRPSGSRSPVLGPVLDDLVNQGPLPRRIGIGIDRLQRIEFQYIAA
jgi:hypothetical protein